MKIFKLLLALIILAGLNFGCQKDDDSSYVDQVVGVYEGSWLVSGSRYNGSCELKKSSSNTVDLIMEILGESVPSLPDVKLSGGKSGEIVLSYTDSSGSLTGMVKGKTISFDIDDGDTEISFSGGRQ